VLQLLALQLQPTKCTNVIILNQRKLFELNFDNRYFIQTNSRGSDYWYWYVRHFYKQTNKHSCYTDHLQHSSS